MTTEEIQRLPTAEKILLMEALWEDMRVRFEKAEIPEEHQRLLDARRARVSSGEAEILNWDDVKGTIGRP